tara:strand:- start:4752 stop:9956 length:5205 start_codon:yes stop_codon:yes gene_type:complete
MSSYLGFGKSKKAELNSIEEKYVQNNQKEIKFDSVTPQQAENIKLLSNVYSFAPPGLVSELGKMGLTKEQAEPYIVNSVNAYVNDGRTVNKDARDYQLSNAGVFSWSNNPVSQALKDTKAQVKKFTQVTSTGLASYPQFVTRIGRTYMIARERAIQKAVDAGQDIAFQKNGEDYLDLTKAYTNKVFMKEFLEQLRPTYGTEGFTKGQVTGAGSAWRDAGPSAFTVGMEQFGEKFFDLNTPGEESGLGNSWFPYFGSGSEAWDESNRRGQEYARFRGSAFSSTTPAQPFTIGGLIAGEFVDAGTVAYRNISGITDGVLFIRGDLGNKMASISQSTRQSYKQWGLIKEVGSDGVTKYRNVDRDKAFNFFMKSDEGKQLATAWAENLDDVNLIVKNFSPELALDMIKANTRKTLAEKTDAVLAAWNKNILREPTGMPGLPSGYRFNKTVESIGLNRIFNNLSGKEKKAANKLFGDWTPTDTFVWQNQAEVIENTRRLLVNGRVEVGKSNKLLTEFIEATLKNTDETIGYSEQKNVFSKIIDEIAYSMDEAKERPDVIESFLELAQGNLKGFSTENMNSYWISDILSWHNVKTAGNKLYKGIEGMFPGQRARLDDLGNELTINGEKIKAPVPHTNKQLLTESITLPDLRSMRNSTGKISKTIRNWELAAGKKLVGSMPFLSDDLIKNGFIQNSRIVDSPRLVTRTGINLLWGVQKGIWVPLQLVTRIAFPVRITMDGQAKLAADGWSGVGKHPLEYFGILLGKNKKTIQGELITKTDEFAKVSRDNTRIFTGDTTIQRLKESDVIFSIDEAMLSARGKQQYLTSVLEEIKHLHDDVLTSKIAQDILNNIDSSVIAKRLFGGDLDSIRLKRNTSLLDEKGMPSNALSTYEKTLAWVDTLFQRVKEVTNDTNVLKYIASDENVFKYKNAKGKEISVDLEEIPQGKTLIDLIKSGKQKFVDDKKFYTYLEDLFDRLGPQIQDEIARIGGNPVGMGFPLRQNGRPTIKYDNVAEISNATKKFLDTAWSALFEFPAGIERAFNRSPLYRTVFGQAQGDVYWLMTDKLKKEYVNSLNKLPKMFDNILSEESLIKQGLDKFFDTGSLNKSTRMIIEEAIEESKGKKPPQGVKLFETLDEVEEYAHARALFIHNNLLFNLAERGYFADFTRLAYPFMGAFIEQVSTWTRVLGKNPNAVRKAGLVVNGAQQEGFISEGRNGEKYFTYPWIGPALEERYFNDQNERLKINASAPVNAINMVTAGFGPGAGPYLQIPAGMFIPDEPEFDLLQKHFNPFGVTVTDYASFKKYAANKMLPAYWIKKFTAWSEGEGLFADQYLWNTHLVQTAQAIAVTGWYVDKSGEYVEVTDQVTGAIDADKVFEGARYIAAETLHTRGNYQGILPAGFTYDYRLRTDAETLNDYKEFFGEDVELGIDSEGYLRFSAIMSLYNNFKTVFDQDDAAAILAMSQALGPNWLQSAEGYSALTYITKGTSYNEAGIRSTNEVGYDWERSNANLEEVVPNTFGLFAPAPEPGADFSYEALFSQKQKGNIVKLNEEEWAKIVNQMGGSRMWRIQTTQKSLAKGGAALTNVEKAEIAEMVDTLFPEWYVKDISLEAGVENWKELERAMSIEVKGEDALPQETINQLKQSPIYETLKAYMDYRETIYTEIGIDKGIKQKYGPSSISYYVKNTQGTQPYRNALKQYGEQLSETNPEFAIFWNRIGSKELQQEYYEDRDGNLISVLQESDN